MLAPSGSIGSASESIGSAKALYITADHVGGNSGGGQVTFHEFKALSETHGSGFILSAADLKLPDLPETPFLEDYVALAKVLPLAKDLNHVHFYSGCFTQTIKA